MGPLRKDKKSEMNCRAFVPRLNCGNKNFVQRRNQYYYCVGRTKKDGDRKKDVTEVEVIVW